MKMKSGFTIVVQCLMHCTLAACISVQFDLFYFKQMWPGSRCNTIEGCCYPKRGKPKADFLIFGLQPIKFGGRRSNATNLIHCDHRYEKAKIVNNLEKSLTENWPSLNCPSSTGFTQWKRNWLRYGTCSNLDQDKYFRAALNLKNKLNVLKILDSAGVKQNGESYEIKRIGKVIAEAIGFVPAAHCNMDAKGNGQLHQIHFCVDNLGSDLITCPPHKTKSEKICGKQ